MSSAIGITAFFLNEKTKKKVPSNSAKANVPKCVNPVSVKKPNATMSCLQFFDSKNLKNQEIEKIKIVIANEFF